MTTALAQVENSLLRLTPEQRELVKRTCMPPNSSDDEFALFIHVAEQKGLDPLQREIHCTKVGGKLQFIADINGLQARAAREPDYKGISQAVVYEKDEFLVDQKTGDVIKHVSNPFNSGRPIGAWAVVEREGKRPFRSMVRFSEYDNAHNPLWRTKPSVMIEKVAKSVALRLAYPVQLGGVYAREELDKVEKEVNPPPETPPDPVKAQSQKLKEAIKSKAASKIIDVQPGETDAQAEKRAAFDFTGLHFDDLVKRIGDMEAWLKKNPKDKAKADEGQLKLAALQAELATRETQDEPPPIGEEFGPGAAG